MKLILVHLLTFSGVLVAAAAILDHPTALMLEGRQRRYMAADLKAHHERMRKIHKHYVPSYPDAFITAYISIGTPAAYYEVALETGSEALFVLAENYPGRNLTADQPFFDPAQSSTAQFAGGYHAFTGTLGVFGSAYEDVVGLFGLDPWFNTTQRFGVVYNVYDESSIDPEMPNGVLGLSWDPKDAANPTENSSAIINLFEELREWRGELDRFYCHWMEQRTSPQYGREWRWVINFAACSDYCANATAENTYPLVWLEESRSLAFVVDSFTYRGQQYAGGFGKVDTGVPNILLPLASFLAVYNDVQPDYDFVHGIYTVDCSKVGSLPDWTFTIGGQTYAVPSTAYVVDLLLPDGQCAFSASISDAETTDFVLGYVFHDIWCIKMDIDNQAISLLDFTPPSS